MRDQVAGRLIKVAMTRRFPLRSKTRACALKPFRSADIALLVHEDDGFVLRIEAEPSRTNAVRRRFPWATAALACLVLHVSSTF